MANVQHEKCLVCLSSALFAKHHMKFITVKKIQVLFNLFIKRVRINSLLYSASLICGRLRIQIITRNIIFMHVSFGNNPFVFVLFVCSSFFFKNKSFQGNITIVSSTIPLHKFIGFAVRKI